MRRTSLSALTAALLLLSACSGLGSLGDILGSIGGTGQQQQQQGQMQVEVQQIDTNGQRIYMRTQNGQSGYVRFDSQTQVIYRQQQYPVTALERGDIVVMQVQQISQNELYASRIDVTQSVRDR
jgi:outer membrane biogenesis lipoprotein LolB